MVYIALSSSAFERLIQLRLLREFRPADEPFEHRDRLCYVDGFEISSVRLDRSPRPFDFVLNRQRADGVVEPAGAGTAVAAVQVQVSGALVLTTVEGVRAAGRVGPDQRYGLPERPDELRVPIVGAELDVWFTVEPNGEPRFNLALHEQPWQELLDEAPPFLTGLGHLTMPFPVGDAFADTLGPGRTRVVNAGITRVDDGVVIRLEFEPVASDGVLDGARLTEWSRFFDGRHPVPFGGHDWAVALPTGHLGVQAAAQVDKQLAAPDLAGHVESTAPAWPSFEPGRPGFRINKGAILPELCAGIDVRATLRATQTLSVPAPNTLRTSVELEVDLDDWDSFKCTVASLLIPLAAIITTYDNGLPFWAVPLVDLIAPVAPIAFGLGLDRAALNFAITKAQEAAAGEDGPTIVRTGDRTFYFDIGQKVVTELTRDWMVLHDVVGAGDLLVLRGAFTAPDLRTLPRLRGRLTDGFEYWSKVDRCSTNPQWQTTASLALELEDHTGAAVRHPVLPVRYGIDLEIIDGRPAVVGEVTWRIVDDPAGVHSGPATTVHWTGLPGVFDVRVREPAPEYGAAPYAFRFQVFSSVGVREFEIPPPPPVPLPPATDAERIAEEAERIASCYQFTSLLHMVKALQVKWLPNPPPDQKVGQHWQILARGLDREDVLYVWDAATGQPLAETRPRQNGLTELSIVLPPERAVTALQVTMNGDPPLDPATYAQRAGGLPAAREPGPFTLMIRQTPLHPLGAVRLGNVSDAVTVRRHRHRLHLTVHGAHGAERVDVDLSDHTAPWSTVVVPAGEHTPAERRLLLRRSSGRRATTDVVEPGTDRLVARYHGVRPWYDAGDVADRYFAQLDDTGATLHLYARGLTRHPTADLPR